MGKRIKRYLDFLDGMPLGRKVFIIFKTLLAIVQLPAFVLHELSHITLLYYFGYEIKVFQYAFIKISEDENGSTLILGRVSIEIDEDTSPLNVMLVSISPLIITSIILAASLYTGSYRIVAYVVVCYKAFLPSSQDVSTFFINYKLHRNKLYCNKNEKKQDSNFT